MFKVSVLGLDSSLSGFDIWVRPVYLDFTIATTRSAISASFFVSAVNTSLVPMDS